MACGLSKSRLLACRQCPKRLWLQVHRSELQEVSDETAIAFGHGHTVGAVAQALQPDGILIETDKLSEALAATRRVMAEQPDRPIFEATFEHEGLLIRADVMTPEAGGYRMTEVKASTRASRSRARSWRMSTRVLSIRVAATIGVCSIPSMSVPTSSRS